jgi:hypothetical protein
MHNLDTEKFHPHRDGVLQSNFQGGEDSFTSEYGGRAAAHHLKEK